MRKILVLLLFFCSAQVFSAEYAKLDKAPIDLSNEDSLQRGARNFINYCLNCHSASYMRYNQLEEIGLSAEIIKNNLLFTAEKVGDSMAIAMDKKEAQAWFGAAPPNLSVTALSRGADWIYSYLRGFYRDKTRDLGWNNTVYPNSAMPHILWQLQGENSYDVNSGELKLIKSGVLSPQEYDEFVGDITNFMVYLSEPHQEKRKKLGYYVIAFLLVLLVLTVLLKREYWKNIK